MRNDRSWRLVGPAALVAAGVAGLVVLELVSPRNLRTGFAAQSTRTWLAGDHHVHSEFSVDYNDSTTPPTPIRGADGRYAISLNAENARRYGLSWMVSTDHGGPNHSKLNRDIAYPELLRARKAVPELLLFYGMEFDTPAADHSSLVIPFFPNERDMLYDIESRFAKRDKFPRDGSWDTEPRIVEALTHMKGLERPPVLIANHPARSATGVGAYGQDTPKEFRDWNDAAPRVAVGMEGAPGHQAGSINRDGSRDTSGARGGYDRQVTFGGFDQMTARVGGLWDSMLGEGRRWWITSTSDSHRNWRDGGSDFWPGEYSKTYVLAARNHDDVLDGLRGGRVFVTTGDLISELDLTAEQVGAASARAGIGGTLTVAPGSDVRVTIRVRDPRGENAHGDTPMVSRVDLITGAVTGRVADRTTDANATARVVARFTQAEWKRNGEYLEMSHVLRDVRGPLYLRVRGTSGTELEPQPDPRGEDPWGDLWFYANPTFVELRAK
ncbi:MAG TPA: hypothetical protein VIP11_08495 [Gemmatimonadaceae bacterium]